MWLKTFWKNHGERLVFMLFTVLFALFFWYLIDMKPEAKTLFIGVAMLCYNKARSNGKSGGEEEVEKPPEPISPESSGS